MLHLRLIFISILMYAPITGKAQWRLLKEKDGIQVYVTDKDSANVKWVKTVAVIPGTYQKIISLFLDVEKQTQWVYATKQAYQVKKISDNELLYYVETALPWPVSNRDAAIRMKIMQETPDSMLKITTVGEPDQYPRQKGKVRIPYFNGDWQITDTGNNQLRIEYILAIDSGANIPSKILNLFIAKGPIETFTKLSQLLTN